LGSYKVKLEIGIMDVLELQQQIDDALSHLQTTETIGIRLSKGSDATDLTSIVDVDVAVGNGRRRTFSIVSQHFLDRLFREPEQVMGIDTSFYASGGPLIVVKSISGNIIVRGIRKYLTIERSRGW
jgi:hypothetical protein